MEEGARVGVEAGTGGLSAVGSGWQLARSGHVRSWSVWWIRWAEIFVPFSKLLFSSFYLVPYPFPFV